MLELDPRSAIEDIRARRTVPAWSPRSSPSSPTRPCTRAGDGRAGRGDGDAVQPGAARPPARGDRVADTVLLHRAVRARRRAGGHAALSTRSPRARLADRGDRPAELLGIPWASALGSAIVDNIPFTAAMVPVVDPLGRSRGGRHWWALVDRGLFGGNSTSSPPAPTSPPAASAGPAAERLHALPARRRSRHNRLDGARDRLHGAALPLAPGAASTKQRNAASWRRQTSGTPEPRCSPAPP